MKWKSGTWESIGTIHRVSCYCIQIFCLVSLTLRDHYNQFLHQLSFNGQLQFTATHNYIYLDSEHSLWEKHYNSVSLHHPGENMLSACVQCTGEYNTSKRQMTSWTKFWLALTVSHWQWTDWTMTLIICNQFSTATVHHWITKCPGEPSCHNYVTEQLIFTTRHQELRVLQHPPIWQWYIRISKNILRRPPPH